MHVVIVGGGFGGVKAALELSKRKVNKITLISKETYFLHHATVYATATGQSSEESVIPLRAIFADHPSVTVINDTITTIDADRSRISSKNKEYHYDKLILALGSVTSFSGVKGAEKHSHSLRTLSAIEAFQDHIHEEVVSKELDSEYIVIGGGQTGVEFAGALDVYLKNLKTLYRLKNSKAHVTIIEQAKRLLPSLSRTSSRKVTQQLQDQGVRIITRQRVENVTASAVTIGSNLHPDATVIWTSGATPNPFFKHNTPTFHLNETGHVLVNPYLEAFDNVYVIGDSNSVAGNSTAWSALAQARYVAASIVRAANGLTVRKFHQGRSIQSTPVGYKWAYTEYYGLYIAGLAGWVVRRWIELYSYCQIMPFKKALPIWRAHDLSEIDTSLD
jgi:NADH:ubiquinone reductase (H+-translocating)